MSAHTRVEMLLSSVRLLHPKTQTYSVGTSITEILVLIHDVAHIASIFMSNCPLCIHFHCSKDVRKRTALQHTFFTKSEWVVICGCVFRMLLSPLPAMYYRNGLVQSISSMFMKGP